MTLVQRAPLSLGFLVFKMWGDNYARITDAVATTEGEDEPMVLSTGHSPKGGG